jgi:hypothetical protein
VNNSSKPIGKDEMIILPYEDIAEVVPSSYDSRFPIKSIFKANTSTNTSSTATLTSSPMHFPLLSSYSSSSLLAHQNSQAHGFTNRGAHRSYWMATGLVPQFIIITFYEKWLIKKVSKK